jgi:polyvinyl alcohol dehydrogenase (cytochrome)
MGLRPKRKRYLSIFTVASMLIVAAIAIVASGPSAVGASATPTARGGGSWPAAGRDIGNTRDAADEHLIGPRNVSKLTTAWSLSADGEMFTTPIVDDGTVYYSDTAHNGGELWAVDARTGRVLWSQDVSAYLGYPAAARVSPAVFGNELIFGDSNNTEKGMYVLAVNRFTGALLWSTQVETNIAAWSTGAPVIYRGVAYMGVSSYEEELAAESGYQCCTFRGSVIALNAATGRLLWKTYTVPAGYSGGAVWGSTPAIDPADHMLYVTTGNNYSVPPGVCTGPTQTGCAPTAADDHFDSVLGLDLKSGAVRWSMPTMTSDVFTEVCGGKPNADCGGDFDFGSGPNLIRLPSGRLLVGAGQKNGVYWALDPRTGAVVWHTLVGPGSSFGGMLWGSATDGRHVYVGVSDAIGTSYQITGADGQTSTIVGGSWAELDAATGKIVWQTADPQGAADLGYVTLANGVLYAGSSADTGNDMYALNAATGAVLWSFAGGGSVAGGAAVVQGRVFWAAGYTTATRCPGGSGPDQFCGHTANSITGTLYAFTLPRRS